MAFNVLSLFDGMSCGQLALRRAGIDYDAYYASEIDKHAITVAKDNFPDTIHLGDVKDITADTLPPIDLLIGGSPCQGFSFAGKQLNFDDPRSALFFEYVRLLKELKPTWFLLENVAMKREYLDVIDNTLGVKGVLIDSQDFSAQRRKRYYWTNIPINPIDGNATVLEDILEDNVDDSYWIADGNTEIICEREVEKNKIERLAPGEYLIHDTRVIVNNDRTQISDVVSLKVFPCLTATRLVKRQNGRRFNPPMSKFYTLTTQDRHGLLINGNIRQLTPIECERLQTVPDDYTKGVSKGQRYKMLGNGWTVDVISHILQGINGGN